MPPIPAVLPIVIAEAHGEELVVTVNGNRADAETVARAELGATLARLVAELGVATRVEIHEPGGRVLVDILEPPAQPEPAEQDVPEPATDGDEPGVLMEVVGQHFTPGEAVAVALVSWHTSADHDGNVRVVIDPRTASVQAAAEVVLAGRISQTVTVRTLT